MLEPVTLHQTRFNAPGLTPDARGVALGRQGAVLFPSLDALVSFFRVLSDEVTLDDLLPSLALHEARGPTGSLAFLVLFQAETSYVLDRAARVASLLGGLTFTGSGKHLVKYRDAASPLGYDVDALSGEPGDAILYADRFTQPLHFARAIPFAQLVFRLSPRRVPGTPGREARERATVWIQTTPGLATSVLSYLHRSRVATSAMMVERDGGRSAFGDRDHRGRYLLVRARELPQRILDLFAEVPGIALFTPVLDNVLVELGFRHPLHLEACKAVFSPDKLYLFAGQASVGLRTGDGVDVVTPPREGEALALVDGEKLVAVGFDLESRADPRPAAPSGPPPSLRVSLRLVPSMQPPRRVCAALLDWSQAEHLRKLVFALPPPVLSGCRVAALQTGLLVVAGTGQGLDTVPLGEPLWEVAPSILVSLGWEILPRIDDALLAERLGAGKGRTVLLLAHAERPLAVDEEAFEPLGRRLLARLEPDLAARSERLGPPRAAAAPTVVNDPAGLFPLWGYRER